VFPPNFARQYDDARFADERPRFSAILSDLTGWIWVRSYAAGWERQGDWLLFDEDGVLRCRVELPDRLRVLQIGEGHLLGVARDELDEESVLLFGLVRGSS
jgi:hypothetical protein